MRPTTFSRNFSEMAAAHPRSKLQGITFKNKQLSKNGSNETCRLTDQTGQSSLFEKVDFL
jgi:hypothetical protein